MNRKNANIIIGLGIPTGIVVALFFFGIFFGAAWGYGGGDMPPNSPNPAKQFELTMMWISGVGAIIGVLLSITSLVVLISRLLRG
jgi:hypothetical protein